MKVKNLAFFGIMASILGVSAASAAGDGTALTTKAYVDKYDAATLQSAQQYTTTALQNFSPATNIEDNSLSGAKLQSGTVSGTKLTDGTVAEAKLDSTLANKINAAAVASSLATVATTGAYSDLSGTPDLETAVPANQTKSDWSVTDSSSAAYIANKPTLGALAAKDTVTGTDIAANANIADTQLSAAVQSSLGKAESALQSGNNVSLLNNDAGYQNSTQVGSAIDTKIGTLDAEINKTDGTVLTGVTEADGKITAVASTKIANANVATDAAIEYSKMATPTVNIDGAAQTCPTGTRCVLTFTNNTWSLTPMNTVADETTTPATGA